MAPEMPPFTIDDALVDALQSRGISFLQSSLEMDRRGLMMCHDEASAEFKSMVNNPEWAKLTFTHFVLDPWTTSASIKSLKNMVLARLRRPDASEDPDGKIPVSLHPGRLVSGHLCVKAFLTGAVRTVFEDLEGRAVPVVIDNAVCTTASEAEVCGMFPEGMSVFIKQPTYTRLWKDGTLGLVVASPADMVPTEEVVHLHQFRNLRSCVRYSADATNMSKGLRSVDDVCTRAESHSADKRWTRALACYSACLDLLDTMYQDLVKNCRPANHSGDQEILMRREYIHSRRCETFLRLGFYSCALLDAQVVSEITRGDGKEHMLQRARCLHGLHQYSEEMSFCSAQMRPLEGLGTTISDSDRKLLGELEDQKLRATIGMRQSGRGIYELDDQGFMRLCRSEYPPGCAPFVGSINLRTARAPGCGEWWAVMVASKDVEEGELLLVTNPLARGEAGHGTRPQLRFCNARPPRTGDHRHVQSWSAQFQNTLVHTLAKAQLSEQYAERIRSMLMKNMGRLLKPSLTMFTMVDDDRKFHGRMKRGRQRHRHNSGRTGWGWELNLETIDIRDIRHVLATNGLIDGALYGLPSFFQHSCAPNCVYYTDSTHSQGAMFIAATRTINAGEELSIHYASLFHTALCRNLELIEHRGQVFCPCRRCNFEYETVACIPELQDVFLKYKSRIETPNGRAGHQDRAVPAALIANLGSERCNVEDAPERAVFETPIEVETYSSVQEWVENVLQADEWACEVLNIDDGQNMLNACIEVRDRVEEILQQAHHSQRLSQQAKDWIRCSLAVAYISPVLSSPGNASPEAEVVQQVVQFLTSVEPGSSKALTFLALCEHKLDGSAMFQILQRSFNPNLFFPFEHKTVDNLLLWGHTHLNEFLNHHRFKIEM